MKFVLEDNRRLFTDFLQLCGYVDGVDVDQIQDVALAGIRFHGLSAEKQKHIKVDRTLENRWYASLDKGEPDYGIYADPLYLAEAWTCWTVYARKYLRNLRTSPFIHSLGEVTSVADLGCGIGVTTAALQQMFPHATVTGTQLPDNPQANVAESLGRIYGFNLVTELTEVGPVDLIFASEYLEHFYEPVAHLEEVLTLLEPRALILASTFTSPSPGHFPMYLIDGEVVSGRSVARRVNGLLRTNGYQRAETGFWNNRPTCWSR